MGINIENLVMEYKKGVKSLDHINLNIDQGIYGLLGENGAGKSTLMKILVTLLTPTEGTVEINGIRLERKNYELIKKEIGYLPQELGLYPLIRLGMGFLIRTFPYRQTECVCTDRNAPAGMKTSRHAAAPKKTEQDMRAQERIRS